MKSEFEGELSIEAYLTNKVSIWLLFMMPHTEVSLIVLLGSLIQFSVGSHLVLKAWRLRPDIDTGLPLLPQLQLTQVRSMVPLVVLRLIRKLYFSTVNSALDLHKFSNQCGNLGQASLLVLLPCCVLNGLNVHQVVEHAS